MKFGASRSQLYDGQKGARAHWEGTIPLWDDSVRRDFEEKTWESLDRQVTEVLGAIDQLAAVFTQIRAECEYDPT